MLSYCLKWGKYKQSKNPEVAKTKYRKIRLLSTCSVCNSKNSKFLKEQETRGWLDNLLGVKVPILGDIPIINTLF